MRHRRTVICRATCTTLLLTVSLTAAAVDLHAQAAGDPAQPGVKTPPRAMPGKVRGRFDDFQIAAGTPLTIRLRTPVGSASADVDDPVRAVLVDAVSQDGVELIPQGSMLHGKVTDVLRATKSNRTGRIALAFQVVEHSETRSLATIATRAVTFDATLGPKDKMRDVTVPADEAMTVTLSRPLLVHIPRR